MVFSLLVSVVASHLRSISGQICFAARHWNGRDATDRGSYSGRGRGILEATVPDHWSDDLRFSGGDVHPVWILERLGHQRQDDVCLRPGLRARRSRGYIGMYISIRANVRTAHAARTSIGQALVIALRGGAVSGVTVVALSLLGVGGLYYLYGGMSDPQRVPFLIVGYGFGASFVALFAQLGGGIYTKAAMFGG